MPHRLACRVSDNKCCWKGPLRSEVTMRPRLLRAILLFIVLAAALPLGGQQKGQ